MLKPATTDSKLVGTVVAVVLVGAVDMIDVVDAIDVIVDSEADVGLIENVGTIVIVLIMELPIIN